MTLKLSRSLLMDILRYLHLIEEESKRYEDILMFDGTDDYK